MPTRWTRFTLSWTIATPASVFSPRATLSMWYFKNSENFGATGQDYYNYFRDRFAIGATSSSHETDTVCSAGMRRVRCPIPRTGINSWIWLRQTILPQRSKIGAATFQYEEPNGR